MAIARESEKLAGESTGGGRMVRGDEKISLQEIEAFMSEISEFKAHKVTKKDLRNYLGAFPQKTAPGKEPGETKVKKSDINFLMNGKIELEAEDLFKMLQETNIEEFDEVEEAFKLLDVDNQGYLTVETFRSIFEKLGLGSIKEEDEAIFKEVADFDKDGLVSLDDFRQILTFVPKDHDKAIEDLAQTKET